MITLIDSLKVASKILFELRNDDRSGKVDAYVKVYNNGREQGYMLKVSREEDSKILSIAFAECRGSDEIVIYNSQEDGVGIHGVNYSDGFYDSKELFNYNCTDEAVDYIFSLADKFQGIEE